MFNMIKKISSIPDKLMGGELSSMQRLYFLLIVLSLVPWPLYAFASAFFFDAPIHSAMDSIIRHGIVLTILFYPLYIFILLRSLYHLSLRYEQEWIYYLTIFIPIAIVFFLGALG